MRKNEKLNGFVFILSPEAKIVSSGPTFEKITGWLSYECIGRSIISFLHPEDLPQLKRMLKCSLKKEVSFSKHGLRFLSKCGKYLVIDKLILIPQTKDKKIVAILGIARDVTKYKLTKNELWQDEQKARSMFDLWPDPVLWQDEQKARSMFDLWPDPVLITDLRGRIVECNQAALDIHGYSSKEELIENNALFLVAKKDRQRIMENIEKCLKESLVEGIEYTLLNKKGDRLPAEISVSALRDQSKGVIGFIIITKDITKYKQRESQLIYRATHDVLTGLPNRTIFNDRFAVMLHQAERDKSKLYLMMLDLDRFKNINDTFGHTIGDEVLQKVGARLKGILRKTDTVARIGGDEFLLILPKIARMEDAVMIAQKILDNIRKEILVKDCKINITASIGLATYPDNG